MEIHSINSHLHLYRVSNSLTRKQICELCNDKFTEKTLYRIETSKSELSKHILEQLSIVYDSFPCKIMPVVPLPSPQAIITYTHFINALVSNDCKFFYSFDMAVLAEIEGSFLYNCIETIVEYHTDKHPGFNVNTAFSNLYSNYADIDLSTYPLCNVDLLFFSSYLLYLIKTEQFDSATIIIHKIIANLAVNSIDSEFFQISYNLYNFYNVLILLEQGKMQEAFDIYKDIIENLINTGNIQQFISYTEAVDTYLKDTDYSCFMQQYITYAEVLKTII